MGVSCQSSLSLRVVCGTYKGYNFNILGMLCFLLRLEQSIAMLQGGSNKTARCCAVKDSSCNRAYLQDWSSDTWWNWLFFTWLQHTVDFDRIYVIALVKARSSKSKLKFFISKSQWIFKDVLLKEHLIFRSRRISMTTKVILFATWNDLSFNMCAAYSVKWLF